jgi:hypothetical protein
MIRLDIADYTRFSLQIRHHRPGGVWHHDCSATRKRPATSHGRTFAAQRHSQVAAQRRG